MASPEVSCEACLEAAAASKSDASSVSMADSSPSKRLSPTAITEAPKAVTAALAVTAHQHFQSESNSWRALSTKKSKLIQSKSLCNILSVLCKGLKVTHASRYSPSPTAEALATQIDPSNAVPASGIAVNGAFHTGEQEGCGCVLCSCVALDLVSIAHEQFLTQAHT